MPKALVRTMDKDLNVRESVWCSGIVEYQSIVEVLVSKPHPAMEVGSLTLCHWLTVSLAYFLGL